MNGAIMFTHIYLFDFKVFFLWLCQRIFFVLDVWSVYQSWCNYTIIRSTKRSASW